MQKRLTLSALRLLTVACANAVLITTALAQVVSPTAAAPVAQTDEGATKKTTEAPAVIEVKPVAHDDEIVSRLEKILTATGWFQSPQVKVDQGVVFLSGDTDDEEYKTWAGDLARKTRDVVAVVNQIKVSRPSPWNFAPAIANMRELGRDVIFWIPYGVLAAIIFLAALVAAFIVARVLHAIVARRIRVPLLQKVISRSGAAIVFLLGMYLVLKICGLTRLALTVVGGTGLVGLVIGIAFRDITENFLASVLLSVQSPFRKGDLIELAGVLGVVQQLNVRTTVLMSLSGHLVQLPNSLVYKSTIRNFTSNPNRREDFSIGIGYEVPIDRAQEVALKVLAEHPAVLKSPEPWVLVDDLGPTTVNLRVYFWLDGSEFSWLKVKSSVIRLVKRAFQYQNVTLPDDLRKVVFPHEVPVRIIEEGKSSASKSDTMAQSDKSSASQAASVAAEGGLGTEAGDIEAQAHGARAPDDGENLLHASKSNGLDKS